MPDTAGSAAALAELSAGKFHLNLPLTPHHLITSSARASNVGGTSRPSVDKLISGRELHMQIGQLLTLENAVNIAAPPDIGVRCVGNQSASGREVPKGIRPRDSYASAHQSHHNPWNARCDASVRAAACSEA